MLLFKRFFIGTTFYDSINKELIVFILAFCIGFISWFHFANLPITGDATYYYHVANIIKDNPANLFTSPNIGILESLNAIIQGFLFLLPGNDIATVFLFHLVLYSLTAVFIFKLANGSLGKIGAIIVLVFFLINHKHWYHIYIFKPGVWVNFLLSVVIYCAYLIYQKSENKRYWIFYGIFTGLLFLQDMRYIPHIGILTLFLIFKTKPLLLYVKRVLLMFVVMLLVITPWIIREYAVFDRFILISDLNTITIHKAFNTSYYRELANYFDFFKNLSDEEFDSKFYKLSDSLNLTPAQLIFARESGKVLQARKQNINPHHQKLIDKSILSQEQIKQMVEKEENKSKLRQRIEYGLLLWKPFQFKYTYEPMTVSKVITSPWSTLSNLNRMITVGILIPFFIIGMFIIFKRKDFFWIAMFIVLVIHTLIHAFTYSAPRYLLPLLPYYTIISAMGLKLAIIQIRDKYLTLRSNF